MDRTQQKTIMFVGAGEYQLIGIRKAKEMGFKVVAIDANAQSPGFALADDHYVVDVVDRQAALAVARKHNIDGVISICAEVCVPTVAYIAHELMLPGITPEAAELATNKYLMRKRFKEHGLPSPKFFNPKSVAQFREAIEQTGYPAIIKPVDESGSRGVNVIHDAGHIEAAFRHAVENSRSKQVIVEEFIDGTECTIEAMSYQGRTEILAISDKKKPESKYRVATQLAYPPDLPNDVIAQIKRVVTDAVKALGIDTGPTHTEVIVTAEGKPVLVEIAARGGGYKIFSDIIRLVSGVDAVEETIKLAMGMTPNIKPQFQKSAVLYFFAPPPGILREIRGFNEAASIKDVEVGLFKKVGETIPELSTDRNRTGYVISWANSRGEALKKIEEIENKVRFVVEEVVGS